MISESLLNDIKVILEIFASGRAPSDDTLVEKLLSWICKELSNSDTCSKFVQATNFQEHMTNLVSSFDDVDGQIWAFVMRLSIHINKQCNPVACRSASQTLRLGPELAVVLTRISEDVTLWAQAAIRCVWLDGMAHVMESAHAEVLFHDYTDKVLECTSDSSWFVCRTAVTLAAKMMVYFYSQMQSESLPGYELTKSSSNAVLTSVSKFVLSPLEDSADSKTRSRLPVSLDILAQAYTIHAEEHGATNNACFHHIYSPNTLVYQLFVLMQDDLDSIGQSDAEIYFPDFLHVFSAAWRMEANREEIRDQMHSTMYICFNKKALCQRGIRRGVQVAAWLLKRVDTCKTKKFELICMLPLMAVVLSDESWKEHGKLLNCYAECEIIRFSNVFIDTVSHVIVKNMLNSDTKSASALRFCLERLAENSRRLVCVEEILASVARLIACMLSSCTNKRAHELSNNSRVRTYSLELCLQLVHRCTCDDTLFTLGSVILKLMLEAGIDQTTMKKSLAVILEILKRAFGNTENRSLTNHIRNPAAEPYCDSGVSHTVETTPTGLEAGPVPLVAVSAEFFVSLSDVLERVVCNQLWDKRDAAVEFLGNVFLYFEDNDLITNWIINDRLHVLVWDCAKDGESYVRASALSALCRLTERRALWTDLTNLIEMNVIYDKIFDIGLSDPEAFPRRAAVEHISSCHSRRVLSISDKTRVITLFTAAANDIDWEVKRTAATFWHSYAIHGFWNGWRDIDFASVCCNMLWSLSTDFDRCVRQVALLALIDIKSRFSKTGVATVFEQGLDQLCGEVGENRTCGDIGLGDGVNAERDQINEHETLHLNENETQGDQIHINKDQYQSNGHESLNENETQSVISNVKSRYRTIEDPAKLLEISTANEFLKQLHDTDLDSLFEDSASSTDQYVDNPASLLEDLIKSCPTSRCARAILEMSDDEDLVPVADCY